MPKMALLLSYSSVISHHAAIVVDDVTNTVVPNSAKSLVTHIQLSSKHLCIHQIPLIAGPSLTWVQTCLYDLELRYSGSTWCKITSFRLQQPFELESLKIGSVNPTKPISEVNVIILCLLVFGWYSRCFST